MKVQTIGMATLMMILTSYKLEGRIKVAIMYIHLISRTSMSNSSDQMLLKKENNCR